MRPPSYSAVILYFRSPESIEQTLRHLQAQTFPPMEIIVVDNASDDEVVLDLERRVGGFKRLELAKNVGYAGGMNAGVRALRVPVPRVLLLTHECALDPDSARSLSSTMSETAAAVVGPLLSRIDNGDIWSAGGRINSLGSTFHYLRTPEDGRTHRYCDWIDGAAMMLDLQVFQRLGGLDERYFLYWEEVDYCIRSARHGSVVCDVSARGTQSVNLAPSFLAARNRLVMWKKLRRSDLVVASVIALLVRGVRGLLHRPPRFRQFRETLTGIKEGIRTRAAPSAQRSDEEGAEPLDE